MHKLFANI